MRNRLAAWLLMTLIAGSASAGTYFVHPDGTGDFPTIQEAVFGVEDGDTIVLMNGVFQGFGNWNISIRQRSITLQSEALDPTACIIDCSGAPAPIPGFWLENCGETMLEGITITNAEDSGIRIYGGTPIIRRCILRDNEATQGGGIYADEYCQALISDCSFIENRALGGGGMCI